MITLRFMYPLWIFMILIATSYKNATTQKQSKHLYTKMHSKNSYIRQNLSLWTVNKTLIETTMYLEAAICKILDDNTIEYNMNNNVISSTH